MFILAGSLGSKRGGNMELKIIENQREVMIAFEEGQTVHEIMKRNGTYQSAPCGGRGICGKCKIHVLDGELPITEQDRLHFSEEELRNGMRLSCCAYPKESLTIAMDTEEQFQVVTVGDRQNDGLETEQDDKEYGFAIDIGTTTIVVELVHRKTGRIIDAVGEVNQQRAYGADVIARISSCNEGNLEKLSGMVREQLKKMMLTIWKKFCTSDALERKFSSIVIAGNTTMCHILMGYSCEQLGVYPFTPVNIQTIHVSSKELFGEEVPSCMVTVLPSISTYVGGDIVSGLVACDFHKSLNVSVLLDLGTNGEMAIGNRERILVTSAAAGPAFEGGNISCGIGSVPGAIQAVSLATQAGEHHFEVRTIEDKLPIGICGSGVIETVAELLEAEIIDETGSLDEDYFDDGVLLAKAECGEIRFTQKDVREIQMAKSAVFSALNLLVKRYGTTMEHIDKVYLAGGFGFYINLEKAFYIGLLPREWKEKIVQVGNSALQGAVRMVVNEDCIGDMERLVSCSDELSLASDKEFSELYMENMFFEGL